MARKTKKQETDDSENMVSREQFVAAMARLLKNVEADPLGLDGVVDFGWASTSDERATKVVDQLFKYIEAQ